MLRFIYTQSFVAKWLEIAVTAKMHVEDVISWGKFYCRVEGWCRNTWPRKSRGSELKLEQTSHGSTGTTFSNSSHKSAHGQQSLKLYEEIADVLNMTV